MPEPDVSQAFAAGAARAPNDVQTLGTTSGATQQTAALSQGGYYHSQDASDWFLQRADRFASGALNVSYMAINVATVGIPAMAQTVWEASDPRNTLLGVIGKTLRAVPVLGNAISIGQDLRSVYDRGMQMSTGEKIGVGVDIAINAAAIGVAARAGGAAKGGSASAPEGPIQVTPQGVALPAGGKYQIPARYVENPYRVGSYGEMVNGKFVERLRIDPPTPPEANGPNYSHYHIDGKKTHYSPKPGDPDPGFPQ
jgi:hypothetical protein